MLSIETPKTNKHSGTQEMCLWADSQKNKTMWAVHNFRCGYCLVQVMYEHKARDYEL